MNAVKKYFGIFLLVAFNNLLAQHIPLNTFYYIPIQSKLYQINDSNIHSDIYPISRDELYPNPADTEYLKILPYLENFAGYSTAGKWIYQYGIGGYAQMHYGRFNAEGTFFSQGGTMLQQARDFYLKNQVYPSQGIVFTKDTSQYTLQNFTGYLNYKAGKYFWLEAGHGKNFIGDGYRSLLLSDYTHNYSYFKVITRIWRFKYLNLYANLKNYNNPQNGNYFRVPNKYLTLHYLSWKITSRWTGGFFEAVVWGGKDSLIDRSFDINYLNPVIFYRPVEYSIGSADNSLMGINTSYKISRFLVIYGQMLIDEFLLKEIKRDILHSIGKGDSLYGWVHNKHAGQIGLKIFDFLIKGTYFQWEWNYARPFIYGHYSTATNYAHFNQSLAHPWGANFREMVLRLAYRKKRWLAEAKYVWGTGGVSSSMFNAGENINNSYLNYTNYYGNVIGKDYHRKIAEIKVQYLLTDKLVAFMDWVNYSYTSEKTKGVADNFVIIGISSTLFQRYWDY